MSYQVLARKWRPRNFQEVVGQQHVLTALANGLAQNRVHHAYLFSGTRGVGKTSIARILAKSLNCEQGVTATPCGKCVHCQAIDQGRFVDLLEIDAASRTKVDDTRELLDNVQYKPAQGRYKVYLIDEVHMLSKHSFNALLKTLEEPPEYVKFLLATTDPQKLPITVLSRCLQFHLKAILPEEIENQLISILQQEQATFEKAAIAVIAKAADGSMRDALSLTDQALAFGSGNIEYQSVLKMLGTIDNSHLHYLLHFIASGNVEKVFQKIQEFVHLGADFAKLHQELASLCHQIALLQMRNNPSPVEKSPIQLLAERLTPEEVQLYYQIAIEGYKDYAFAPNGKIAFEMTVMRLLAFRPANYIAIDESLIKSSDVVADVPVVSPVAVTVEAAATVAEKVTDIPAVVQEVQAVTPQQASEPQAEQHTTMAEPLVNTAATAPVAPGVMQEQTESIQQVTNSRNMLRSHRLKREQVKKSQATTVNEVSKSVVAEPPRVQKTANKPAPVKKQAVAPEPENNSLAMPEQPLPPVESYLQDQPETGNEFDNLPSTPYQQTIEQHTVVEKIPPSPPVLIGTGEVAVTDGQDFFSAEMLDVPAINIAEYVQDKLTDSWSLLIQQMQLSGLVKLLAKNSVMKQVEQQIILTLKPEQQHLLNNSSLCEQLQAKLKAHFGEQASMYIEVGNVQGQLTAVESEQFIFEQYLQNAKRAIQEDPNIQILRRDYDAKIYENSVIPL